MAATAFMLLAGSATAQKAKDNTLSPAEKKAGYELLFNGKDKTGWKGFNDKGDQDKWVAKNGELMLTGKGGGDLITTKEFENFELLLDWKISPKGNSGIFYLGKEAPEFSTVWKTAPEMQILDDDNHPDGKIPSHRSGALYDLITPFPGTTKPVGQYNSVRIVVKNGEVEHWQNGHLVAKITMWTPDWEWAVKNSKFKDFPHYGSVRKGVLGLQDHGDPVWFKNIKVRRL